MIPTVSFPTTVIMVFFIFFSFSLFIPQSAVTLRFASPRKDENRKNGKDYPLPSLPQLPSHKPAPRNCFLCSDAQEALLSDCCAGFHITAALPWYCKCVLSHRQSSLSEYTRRNQPPA